MKKLVVLTGAGISAESGLATFRGDGGLWEGYNVYDVATPGAWQRDPELVLKFYNWRRQQVRNAKPNAAHLALVELEKKYLVTIITQNVDDLHERAGSSNILHLHGELLKARSSRNSKYVVDLGEKDIEIGDTCPFGHQLRPHIVWFGEDVPEIFGAMDLAGQADILIVIGTSLKVYPAASLIPSATYAEVIYVINPDMPAGLEGKRIVAIKKTACEGVPELVESLLAD